MSSITLKNINKIYKNGFHAIKNLNLTIDGEEFVVLLGPSGCGKSTALRMIAGLEEITSGEIYINEELINDISAKDRDIAMVFQNYALYPHMSVFDNMAFGLKMRKVSKQDINKKIKEVASSLGIVDLLDRRPNELSGGQKQRVALGRAIARNPRMFLMDEPLSNIDAKLRTHMRAEIIKLYHKLNTTFIYVTHDQTEAMTMGTKIVVMDNGIVQQIADPQTIYDKPTNLFVASFIGNPQMNFLNALVIKENDQVYFKFGEFKIKAAPFAANKLLEKNYKDKDVIIGIRPENIKISHVKKYDSISLKIEVVEMLGSENIIYLDAIESSIIVKTNPDIKAPVGSYLNISFAEDKIHVFDKANKNAVINL